MDSRILCYFPDYKCLALAPCQMTSLLILTPVLLDRSMLCPFESSSTSFVSSRELPSSLPLPGELVGENGSSSAPFLPLVVMPSSLSLSSEVVDDSGSSSTNFVLSAELPCSFPLPGELVVDSLLTVTLDRN